MQSGTTTDVDSTGAVTSSTGAAPTTGATTGGGAESSTVTSAGTSTTGVTPGTTTSGGSSGGASTTGEGSTTGEDPPCCVAPAEPTSSVQAATPIGAAALPWASFGESGGECGGSIFMYLFPDAASVGLTWVELEGVDHLRVTASSYLDMWPDGFTGTGPVSIEAHFGGQLAMIDGEITILEFVPEQDGGWCDPEMLPFETDAHVSFTIALKSDGWQIEGQVLAPYCPSLNVICP